MRRTLQKAVGFYLFLFVLPILFVKIPILAFEPVKDKVDTQPVVYASNVTKEIPANEEKSPINVLLLFTHSHEAYHPILKHNGLQVVNYHPTSNITDVSKLLSQHLQLNGATVDVLSYDYTKEMKNRPFYQAYDAIRPILQKQLAEESYDLVLDLHRDALSHKASTIEFKSEGYARISLVVGAEHPNFKFNEAYAKSLNAEVNRLVPSISRGVITKSADSGNGVYNQDLSPHSVLIELGGIENTEEELNRTIAIISKAISIVFENREAT